MFPEDIDPPFTDDDIERYFEYLDPDIEPAEDIDEELGARRVAAEVARWSVCDTGSADWAMRKLARAEAVIAARKAEHAKFKAQIDDWLAGEVAVPLRSVNFFTGQIEARRLREEEDRKTLKLPSGEVTSRLNPARAEIPKDDEERFIEWARTTPMVKAKWSPVLAEVKKRVTFETVRVPDFGDGNMHLVRWPRSDGEAMWVAVPENMSEFIPVQSPDDVLAAEDLPNFHDETWAICEGCRVPGVVQVPAEVTFTVKPIAP